MKLSHVRTVIILYNLQYLHISVLKFYILLQSFERDKYKMLNIMFSILEN